MLLSVLAFSGCTSEVTDSTEETGQTGQSIWCLLDKSGNVESYLYEDDADVTSVTHLIQQHISCVDNRSANSLNLDDEWATYTATFQEQLNSSGYQETLKNLYENNALEITSIMACWNQGEFDSDKTNCKVMIGSVFQFVQGSEEYIDNLGVQLSKNYIESRIYYCTKSNGIWKISSIQKSALSAY